MSKRGAGADCVYLPCSPSQSFVARQQARYQPDPIIFHILYLVWWLDESCALRTDQVWDIITIIYPPRHISHITCLKSLHIIIMKICSQLDRSKVDGHTHRSCIIIHTIQDTETVIHHQHYKVVSGHRLWGRLNRPETKQYWLYHSRNHHISLDITMTVVQHNATIYWKNSIIIV